MLEFKPVERAVPNGSSMIMSCASVTRGSLRLAGDNKLFSHICTTNPVKCVVSQNSDYLTCLKACIPRMQQ
jgi:hypothetical protein